MRSRQVHHRWLYAVDGGRLPSVVLCAGRSYELVQTFKHDFVAATGLYRSHNGLAVLKINRTNDFFGLPMKWAGRRLRDREVSFYQAAADLPGVPALIGLVGQTGFMHAYVPGQPLGRINHVPETFFDQLLALVRALHARHIAYVDLNKRDNILIGDDGRPYLIDFQIALRLPPVGWRGWAPLRWLLRRFQQGDYYHFLKHKRRLRPDLLTVDELRTLSRPGVWIRLHRWITWPLTWVRRRALRHLRLGRSALA